MCTDEPKTHLTKEWLVNEEHQVVDDALNGLVRCNPQLALLDIGRVIVIRDHLKLDKVKLLAGSSSGHEPACAGFVGRGMLTASVQGGIFRNPTPDLIFRTIKELARRHDNGILIISSNDTSSKLAFGLAIERSHNLPNLKVKMLLVSDWIYKENETRGLTGTILIQKIAGAMSEKDFFLHDIYLFCKPLLKNIATVLVSLCPAKSPLYEVSSSYASRKSFLQDAREVEFGAGLHGEPGFMKMTLLSCHDTVTLLLSQITDPKFTGAITLEPEIPIILLINNLGTTSKTEELIFINEVVSQLQKMHIHIAGVYCGSFVTSLKMSGFSLTILKVINADIITYLRQPTEAPFWNSFSQFALQPKADVVISTKLASYEKQVKPYRGPKMNDNVAEAIGEALNFACGALVSCEIQLNIMDSEYGDGDTGTNLRGPALKIIEYIQRKKLITNWPFMLFEQLSKIMDHTNGGLLPCLYAIMFEAAAKPFFNLHETDAVTQQLWLEVMESVCKAMRRYDTPPLGTHTMFDVFFATKEAVKANIAENLNSLDLMGLATITAESTALRTRKTNEDHPDSGAHSVGIWMRAVYESFKLHSTVFEDAKV